MRTSLTLAVERFPIEGGFVIARGARTESVVVTATLGRDGARGRGECVPYARYGETVEGVAAAIAAQEAWLRSGILPQELASRMPPGNSNTASLN